MKLVAAIFTLLFLPGTQARYLWMNEEPQTPTDRFKELVSGYLKKIHELGKEKLTQLEASDFGRGLDLQIAEKFDDFSSNVVNLGKKVQPYVENVRKRVEKELLGDLSSVEEKINPIVEQFHQRWSDQVTIYQEKVTSLYQQLQQQAKENIDTVREKIRPLAEEFRDKLRAEADVLRVDLAPVTEEIRRKRKELQEKAKTINTFLDQLKPLVHKAKTLFQDSFKTIEEIIKSEMPWLPHHK
ncbi:apolipoprotein A-I [Microcaecilia unicolor]|uniref:Apolipoprotein A-I n=1 Tax=Microcaecilia unicolor TaxID=1415580 RepID=A0A6P7ZWR3_9AMPH|nr:apolipoprotein A-I [Microcaecilia unicolor]